MFEWVIDPAWIPALMFGGLVVCLLSGFPVAWSLGGLAAGFAAYGMMASDPAAGLVFIDPTYMGLLPQRIYGVLTNSVLLAVPFFIFMGTVLEKSKLAEDLLQTIGQLFGPVRGGLALAVVLVGTLLAAATGVIGASVVAMGLISLPVMLRYGYKPELATGVIAASGTLGQIIPPSVVLVVLGDQLGVPVGDLFKAALTPGLALSGLFMLLALGVAVVKPAWCPALPLSERSALSGKLLRRVLLVMLPPLGLVLLVLGSIFAGIATPTEAGSLGALGAMVLAALNRRLTRRAVIESMEATVRLSCMVGFLLIGSTAFSMIFRGYGGDDAVRALVTALPGGLLGALLFVHLLVFLLGFFIDFFEIAFILLPLVVPALLHTIEVDPDAARTLLHVAGDLPLADVRTLFLVWFGIQLGMNLQTSFLSPPFGFALFYLKGICPPEIKTLHIYRGVMPFIVLQVLALALTIMFPAVVLWVIR
jgi:tripartite ATP-independent transporter DctM subunit